MRSLVVFLQKLAEFIHKGINIETKEKELEVFYEEMLSKKRDYFVNIEIENVLREFEGNDFNVKIRILAELFYTESIVQDGYTRKYFAEKSLYLFNCFNQNNTVYDINVFQKIDTLSQMIKNE